MDPRGAGHILIDNLDHAAGGIHRRQRQPVANMARQRLVRRLRIEGHAAAGKPRRVEPAKNKVGIGHCCVIAATRIAGRPGIRPGALRADADPVQPVDRGNRPTAGADFNHLDDRDFQRCAAPLHESVGAVHLELAVQQGLAIINQTDLRRCAAHIEGDQPVLAKLARHMGGEDCTPRRPRFNKSDWKSRGCLDRHQAAATGHQQAGASQSGVSQAAFKIGKITGDHRPDIGIGDGGRLPFIFADLGTDIR